MKIFNVSSIIPLEGLKRENDIVLRIQDHLKEQYDYEFTIAKSLPLAPRALSILSKKWKKYNELVSQGNIEIQGYKSFIYPWIMPPTSNLWLNYILIPLNIFMFNVFLRKKLLNLAQNCDVILSQNNIPDAIIAYLLSKQTNKPYIVNVRGDFNPIVIKLPLLKQVYKNATHIITHSPKNHKILKDKISIKLIPHPIESRFFSDQKKAIRQPVEFISVCRLLKLKHLNWVINSLAALKREGYSFRYRIVGDGPELRNLKNLVIAKHLESNIIFEGYKDYSEIHKYLTESHIFIMPSYPETLGRSFLEAAASNCLIIGHKNSGVDGLLEHAKSAVFIEKNTLSKELRLVFERFSEEYIQFYSNNAKRIVNNLTWNNIGDKYHQLYKNTEIKKK